PLIQQLRAIERHRLLVATDQEGGGVCIAIGSVPCKPMPVGQQDTTAMATALKALGFDLDLGPVSDVCSGTASIMWGRCYGTSPAQAASSVGAVVDGIHAAGMLSAAKHFPGPGDTTATPEAAVEFLVAGGDMVMVAHHLSVADATYDAIKSAAASGRLPRSRLDDAVRTLQALPGG